MASYSGAEFEREHPVQHDAFPRYRSQSTRLAVTPAIAFGLTLAAFTFVGADALFPLLVSGGQEIDIDTAATSRVRMVSWLFCYLLAGLCFVISWRAVMDAIRENIIFMLLIAFAVLSSLWSGEAWRSAYSAVQLGVLSLFALTVAQRLPLERALKVIGVVYALIVILSLALVVARPDLGISSSIMYNGAWRGIFIHKNHFGTQLSFAFVTFFCGMVLLSRRWRIICSGLAMVVLFLCVMSRSSTALLTCLAIPGIYMLIVLARQSRSLFLAMAGIAVAGCAAFVTILAGGWDLIMDALGKDPDLSGRTELWSMIFSSIESRPVLGFGYDSYWSSNARDGGAVITRSLVWSPGGAHNSWIELTTQLGFTGLFLWLAVFLRTIRLSVKELFAFGVPMTSRLLWPALLCVPIITWSLVESNLMRHGNSVHFLFALLTGYVVHFLIMPRSIEGNGRPTKGDASPDPAGP
jgi:O-antigen ligase